ncbi:MAG TPA: type III pantothenate kinase, partial [Thermoanaerobaculia bacterium]|nr:type III pantothenate kinase [Thermoanaerobaculia bacterium]
MLLAVDIGNTTITLGLYDGEKPGPRWRLETVRSRLPDEYGLTILALLAGAGLSKGDVSAAALSSVVPPLTGTWVEVFRRSLGVEPLVVETGVRTGVRVLYDDPKQVGADRIVNAAAVKALWGGPACIVDFGTGTTFDALSARGEYLGGAIAPGIGIAAEALHARAAKLPRVDLVRPPFAIGRNTEHALQSGLVFGYVGLVEGMVARFRAELGPEMKVIATGGYGELIAKETPVLGVVAPWLTLDG